MISKPPTTPVIEIMHLAPLRGHSDPCKPYQTFHRQLWIILSPCVQLWIVPHQGWTNIGKSYDRITMLTFVPWCFSSFDHTNQLLARLMERNVMLKMLQKASFSESTCSVFHHLCNSHYMQFILFFPLFHQVSSTSCINRGLHPRTSKISISRAAYCHSRHAWFIRYYWVIPLPLALAGFIWHLHIYTDHVDCPMHACSHGPPVHGRDPALHTHCQ